MRTILLYVTLLLVSVMAHQLLAQDEETVQYQIAQLEKKKKEVTQMEKEALKEVVKIINEKLEKGEITAEEAQERKEKAAMEHAKNIENKVAILQNSIELLERRGKVDLNTEPSSVEIGFGAEDDQGEMLFGIKYNSGRQKEVVYDKRTYDHLVVAVGFNNAIIDGQSLEDSPYKLGGSRFLELGWAWHTRVFKNTNFLRFNYGFSFQFNGLKPTDNQYFVLNGEGQGELQEFEQNLDKAKLRMDNLVLPIHFEFGPSKFRETERSIRYSLRNQFRLGLGGYAGFNLGTRQKLKYERDGEDIKEKIKRSYNTSNFIYGLSAYAGFDSVLLYLKYDLNPIFRDAQIEQRNVSLGVRFDL